MGHESSHEGRLSTVEANVGNIARGVGEIKDILKQGANNHTEVMTRLALIESHQKDFRDYQKTCEIDRKAHDKRLNSVEGYQSRQAKVISVLAGLISVTMTGAIELLRK